MNLVRLLALLGSISLAACQDDGARAFPIPGERHGRVIVEVLNAGGRPGAARVGARTLRRAGIDVVYFGNAESGTLDSTRIVVRRGDQAAAQRVRSALKAGRITVEPDSTRLLDITVLPAAQDIP